MSLQTQTERHIIVIFDKSTVFFFQEYKEIEHRIGSVSGIFPTAQIAIKTKHKLQALSFVLNYDS